MKTYLSKIILLCMAVLFGTACEKEPELTVLEAVQFSAAPQVSTPAIILSAANKSESVLTISWPEVTFPVKALVTYSVQLDLSSDTIGVTAWSKAITVEAGADVLSKAFLGTTLNTLAQQLGLTAGEPANVVMRIQSTLDRSTYSPAVSVLVTPFVEVIQFPSSLWVAGDYQGWNVTSAPTIVSANKDGVYEGYIYIPAGGTNEFKLYAQPAWEPVSYGNGGDGKVIEANFAGANFTAPSDGYYLLAVNLNTMTYLLIKTSWGIIGGATPSGWDADTPMSYDPSTQTWKVTATMTTGGSFKFRANNAWQLDFGVAANGNLAYANHPWYTYVDQPQLSVPENGRYDISLDLHKPGQYRYEIKKN